MTVTKHTNTKEKKYIKQLRSKMHKNIYTNKHKIRNIGMNRYSINVWFFFTNK